MSVIDDYLASLPEQQKKELQRIRTIVKQTVPDAEETISYGMPAFKYKDKPLFYFSAFKSHMSVFPTSEPIESTKDKLEGFKVSKGTIQFTEDKPIPESIIKELLLIRVAIISKD